MSAAGRVRTPLPRALIAAAVLGGLIATPTVAQGDAARGEVLFTYEGHGCIGCHPQTRDPYAFGPSLCRVVGNRAGVHPAYDRYSDAIRNSGIVWDVARHDHGLRRHRGRGRARQRDRLSGARE